MDAIQISVGLARSGVNHIIKGNKIIVQAKWGRKLKKKLATLLSLPSKSSKVSLDDTMKDAIKKHPLGVQKVFYGTGKRSGNNEITLWVDAKNRRKIISTVEKFFKANNIKPKKVPKSLAGQLNIVNQLSIVNQYAIIKTDAGLSIIWNEYEK